jgi:aminopeptidase N
MKYLLPLFLLFSVNLCFSQSEQLAKQKAHAASLGQPLLKAPNERSDTIDILNYTINLRITDFVTNVIAGNTEVKFSPKVNGVNSIALDLLELIVDSIEIGGSNLVYTYNDTLLVVDLPSTMNINDTATMVVHYHGTPQVDAQFGGFYFQSGYAFNLGVGFEALPHVFGRAWFPCFDNFVERSTYVFNITTNGGKIALCNGMLTSDTTDGFGFRTRQWTMNEEIPTYLASVSVAPYAEVHQTYNGINGPIPIILAAVPADTAAVKNSFINLPVALSTFEGHFGPYLWNRVGYCMVPFNSGAMEHATNISYPKITATGSITYQALYAHELAHHWFGDLATCRTAEDMWLNEGWARYCEFLFTEALYGEAAYMADVRVNHEENLHFNIVKEGNLSLGNIPQTHTYGDHVYNKGADVAHTLRGYLGDSLFFYSVRTYLSQNNYKDVSSADFRDALTAASGVDMTDFFNDWVFNPGWTHFSIDSFTVAPSGPNFLVNVYVKQKLNSAPFYYTNVPLEVTFKAADWTEQTETFMMSGPVASFSFTLPFEPVFAAVNMYEKISDAVAPEIQKLNSVSTVNFANAKMSITVQSITDSAFVRVTHNYVAPDPYKTCCIPYRLSPNRYWTVDGILPSNFKAKATVTYEGRTLSFSGYNYLDNNLINTYEDSLVLMYRKNPADEWAVYPYFTRNMFATNNDKRGSIVIDSLQLGEYVLAMKDASLSVSAVPASVPSIKLYPNPAGDFLHVDLSACKPADKNALKLVVTDISGRVVHSEQASGKTALLRIMTSSLKNGIYTLSLQTEGGVVATEKFVVAH